VKQARRDCTNASHAAAQVHPPSVLSSPDASGRIASLAVSVTPPLSHRLSATDGLLVRSSSEKEASSTGTSTRSMRSAPAAEAEAGPCPLGCRACRTVTLPVNPRGFGFSLRTEKVHFFLLLCLLLFSFFFLGRLLLPSSHGFQVVMLFDSCPTQYEVLITCSAARRAPSHHRGCGKRQRDWPPRRRCCHAGDLCVA
jgi:hypothetical protein